MTSHELASEHRSTVALISGGVEAVMPTHPNWLSVIFFSAMFFVCIFMIVDGSSDLLANGIAAGIASLIPMFLIGPWILLVVLWHLFGRVRLRLTHDEAFLRHEIFGFGFRRNFAPGFVKNLRTTESPENQFGIPLNRYTLPWIGGMLSFDYGEKIVRFAASLDEAEAFFVADRINHFAPWLHEG